jgi:hypothetical protein
VREPSSTLASVSAVLRAAGDRQPEGAPQEGVDLGLTLGRDPHTKDDRVDQDSGRGQRGPGTRAFRGVAQYYQRPPRLWVHPRPEAVQPGEEALGDNRRNGKLAGELRP